MNYKKRFINAYQKSLELGLKPDDQALPFRKNLSERTVEYIWQLCTNYLNSIGYTKSSELAEKCIPVHMALQVLLRDLLSVESSITIGDKFYPEYDYYYCKMSYKYILHELSNPNVNATLKAHVWLTLRDGSVLDCTAEAHMDLLLARGEHPTHQCIAYYSSNQSVPKNLYRPYLIGSEFLKRTGAFAIVPT